MNQRYEIREEIGKGGLGAVYKAFDTQLHREVAMKRVLTTERASEEEVQAAASKLIAEAKTLSSLNHPNIVTVFDVGQDEKGGFVVMELLKGETLDETVARGVLTQDDFIEVVYQTMEALLAAQASDVLHRDLKPTNVMVIWQPSGKFQTKILDFGLAKFSKAPSVQTMDQEDAVMGSIYFMAPEQFERSELDTRTDLYQIGCVYYHALTGQYPFRGETAPQVMNAHLQHRVTPLDKLRPDLSPSICQWVMWLINREMENRPEDARDALARFPRNPEPPQAEPVLQAIPVEEAAEDATSGVQVVLPSAGAAPPRVVTGSAPVSQARTGSQTVSHARTGSHPVRGRRGPHTGPISGNAPKPNRLPLILSLVSVGIILLSFVGFLIVKNAREAADRDRIKTLAAVESPSGTAEDVELAVKFLESRDATGLEKRIAGDLLSVLQGAGVDSAIVSALQNSTDPYARLVLSKAAGERGLSEAVPAMMDAFASATNDAQKTEILFAVRRLATRENLPALLDTIGTDLTLNLRMMFENIVIAVYRREPLQNAQVQELSSRLTTTSGAERQSLFRILGALGTREVQARLKNIFAAKDGTPESVEKRKDAVAAFQRWPNRSILPLLESILLETDNSTEKTVVSRAYVRVSTLPAAVPIEEKITTWEKAIGFVTRPNDAQPIFAAMIENPGPQVRKVLEEGFEGSSFAGIAKAAKQQMESNIKEAPVLTPGQKLTPVQGEISGENASGAFLSQDAETFIGWNSPSAWFVWHFKVKEPGDYGFSVLQSYVQEGTSEFELIVNGTSLPGTSQTTPSETAFTKVKLDGSVALEPGVIYTATLHAKGVTQPRMMDVQGIVLEKR